MSIFCLCMFIGMVLYSIGLTPSDYLTELNAESQAQLNMKLHEIQLMMAKINLNTTLGF